MMREIRDGFAYKWIDSLNSARSLVALTGETVFEVRRAILIEAASVDEIRGWETAAAAPNPLDTPCTTEGSQTKWAHKTLQGEKKE